MRLATSLEATNAAEEEVEDSKRRRNANADEVTRLGYLQEALGHAGAVSNARTQSEPARACRLCACVRACCKPLLLMAALARQ